MNGLDIDVGGTLLNKRAGKMANPWIKADLAPANAQIAGQLARSRRRTADNRDELEQT